APLGKGTILLVEDETEVRRLARQVMETAGYTVLEAHEGNEALALCQRNETSIDLLLTDVIMPGMSGRELADRLTTMRPTMKVLFVSGYTDDRLGRHGVLEPGVEFLAKPFSPAELLERIHEALGTR
ncbi:MAG TPA: response regulator, partial [Methylomirabilota bacterium]|nr:response regulator [Methylomirabilota bacterium]